MSKVVKKKSVLPIYLIGIVWLLWAIFGSLYRPIHFILAAVVSIVVYTVGKAVFPDRSYTVQEEETPKEGEKAEPAKKEAKSSYPPEIQALISERDKAVSEMRRLNDAIKDETISAQIDRLESTTGKIVDAVVDEPSKQPQIRKFMNYYLPTTLKLLNAYDRMDSAGVAGDNISSTKERVEKMMDTLVRAYDKQLDALFGDEARDISTDITVLENMLRQEGFASGEKTNGEDGSITLEL